MSLDFQEVLGLISNAPPELGPGPRAGVLSVADIDQELEALWEKSSLSPKAQELVRATIYLWHDHLDASHSIAQGIETPDGSLVHGIMHRREPDYGNARYWFHRVGEHVCFPTLAERAASITSSVSPLQKELLHSGKWDAFAFIDECEHAAKNPSHANLLREVQAAESRLLLEHFLGKK
jgi:hypothetical protein